MILPCYICVRVEKATTPNLTLKGSAMKTYRLLKDIDNPEHDKRCAYGYRQYDVFKAGTFFEGYPAHLDVNQRFNSAYVRSKEWSHLGGDVAALIIGNSQETEPTTWHEIATLDGGYHHFSDEVIEQLLKHGDVTLDQVKIALAKCLSE